MNARRFIDDTRSDYEIAYCTRLGERDYGLWQYTDPNLRQGRCLSWVIKRDRYPPGGCPFHTAEIGRRAAVSLL
jgi:hypothetical protein